MYFTDRDKTWNLDDMIYEVICQFANILPRWLCYYCHIPWIDAMINLHTRIVRTFCSYELQHTAIKPLPCAPDGAHRVLVTIIWRARADPRPRRLTVQLQREARTGTNHKGMKRQLHQSYYRPPLIFVDLSPHMWSTFAGGTRSCLGPYCIAAERACTHSHSQKRLGLFFF